MTESERRGLVSSFYFIPNGSSEQIIRYSTANPIIQDLMKSIDVRGHEIGYHASYDTYLDPDLTRQEVDFLRRSVERAGIRQQIRGGRQHYLRWRTPTTFRNLAKAGLVYDTTVGFADRPGFRTGTCWESHVYDVVSRRRLNIIERPLVVMEHSVTSGRYMAVRDPDAALGVFNRMKTKCMHYSGDYTLLWHNSALTDCQQRQLFSKVIS